MTALSINIVVPVYNKANYLEQTLGSINNQSIPSDCTLLVTAVNDGSTDNSLSVLEGIKSRFNNLKILDLERNSGRSQARNAGARASQTQWLIFLDADCSWEDPKTLEKYVHQFKQGKRLYLGVTSSKEDDYWGRYYAKVYNKRITLTDIVQHATTANFGCHSSVFESTQGFPTEYKHYGFEDRDFLINATLQCQQSEILYDPRLIASNNDRTSLEEITKKMQESARYSATIFKRRYPEVYKKTAYAKLDLNEHNRVIISCYRILRPLLTLIQKGTIGLFKLEWLPFSCRAFLTKLASGLAYLDGSYLAWHSKVKKD